MNDFERLKYVFRELENIIGVTDKKIGKYEIRQLKEDISNYLKMVDPDFNNDSMIKTETTILMPCCPYKYDCSNCKKEFYRATDNLFNPTCFNCSYSLHRYKKRQLFYENKI